MYSHVAHSNKLALSVSSPQHSGRGRRGAFIVSILSITSKLFKTVSSPPPVKLEDIQRLREATLKRLEDLKHAGGDHSSHSLAVLMADAVIEMSKKQGLQDMNLKNIQDEVSMKMKEAGSATHALSNRVEAQAAAIVELTTQSELIEGALFNVS